MTTEAEATTSVFPQYSVSIVGNGLQLEREVPEHVVRVILGAILGGDTTLGVDSAAPSRPDRDRLRPNQPDISIGEFLEDSKAQRMTDKIAAIAVYLKTYHGRESFDRDDVKTMFQRAGEAMPGNFSRDFNSAIASRWIAPGTTAGEFYVTRTGEETVAKKFVGTVVRSSNSSRRRSKKKDEESTDE